MTGVIATIPRIQFSSALGLPLAGGKLYTYLAGTTTPVATYQDEDLTAANENPIPLDSTGSCVIWLDPAKQYKFVLKSALGITQPGWPVDNISGASNLVSLQPTLSLYAKLSVLAAATGSSLVSFIQALVGSKQRTVEGKLSERVSVADFLDTDTPTASQVVTALQAAVNSGALSLFISKAYPINAPVTLAANQTIYFDGGSLTVAAGTTAPDGILYGNGKANITIFDPVIDASATSGIGGINLVDCPDSSIVRSKLTKCNINLQSTDPATAMDYRVENCKVDMASWNTATAIYISGANGVHVTGSTTCNGKEGIGGYNGSSNVIEMGCHHRSHTQDGSIRVKCTKSITLGSISHGMGQSGFTTQRYTAGTDVQDIILLGNLSYGHTFDCYDIRGQVDGSAAWGVDMRLVAVGNIGVGSSGCGAYNVLAEGNLWAGNLFAANGNPGFLANLSPRTSVIGVTSFSNASLVAAGSGNAGVLFQDSPNSGVVGAISTNSAGATQNYGVSFTGTSVDGFVTGGFLQNTSVAPVYLGSAGTSAYVTGAAMQTTGNVWAHGVVGNTGAYIESGFGAPTHVRQKGSIFARTDGASGELYTSNGDGTWHSFP